MPSDLTKILKRFRKYKTESILIILSIIITAISLLIFVLSSNNKTNDIIIEESEEPSENKSVIEDKEFIVVDISGAVNNPGVYQFKKGLRINDVLKKAGGLAYNADNFYFYRNFNLAAYIFDQEKIYVPYLWEISSGIFVENSKVLNYLTALPQIKDAKTESSNEKTNINEATIEELDELSGIGAITAQKIIQNRPYTDIQELESKKIVNKSVFENIKEQISIN